ncbi:uncharacterized protein LOC123519768 [Portunus trituberculatus]|uniref:uncharacterized protein LOC123519768 n=1 Tax=Portunus trituberculatus TaxID=210409 RepID=UPI001E1CC304|nr:uncharacterized protein LOC123519768 [Portunus trituberculatus]
MTLFCNASLHGWGAHVGESLVSGLWSLQEKNLHINHLEILVVFRALQALQRDLSGTVVNLISDNTTVVTYLRNSGGTQSKSLSVLTWVILRWCEDNQVLLRPKFVPGWRNAVADVLNRECVGSDWTLYPVVCKWVFQVWSAPQVDLFATALNHQLPLYVSLLPDPNAWKQDVFAFPWEGLDRYAFSPFSLIRRVLVQVRETSGDRVSLIAPRWPQADWFPLLLSLLVDHPRVLPQWDSLLRQLHRHLFHKSPATLHLHAWRLSSVSSEREAFREKLQGSWPCQSDSLRPGCTRRSGPSTVVGVSRGAVILSWPL